MSMALLQGYFLGHKTDPEKALCNCGLILDQIAKEGKAKRKKKEEKKHLREEKKKKKAAKADVEGLVKMLSTASEKDKGKEKEETEATTEKGENVSVDNNTTTPVPVAQENGVKRV